MELTMACPTNITLHPGKIDQENMQGIYIYIYTCMYVNHCIYTIVLGHLSKNFNFFITQT